MSFNIHLILISSSCSSNAQLMSNKSFQSHMVYMRISCHYIFIHPNESAFFHSIEKKKHRRDGLFNFCWFIQHFFGQLVNSMVQQTKFVTYSYNHYDYEIPIKNGSKLKVTFLPKSAHHHHTTNINGIMTDLHSSSTNTSGENSSPMLPYEDKGPKICHLVMMMVMMMMTMMMMLITVM